jgi:hypothetical protein
MDLLDRYVSAVKTYLPAQTSKTTSAKSSPRTSSRRWMTARPRLGGR